MIRAFFAIEPAEDVRATLQHFAADLYARDHKRAIRWVRAEQMHLTVRFLGEVEQQQLDELLATVRPLVAGTATFSLQLLQMLMLPNTRQPRVIALQLSAPPALLKLVAGVEQAALAAGLPAERRAYRPHLTLGRVREGQSELPRFTQPVPQASWDCDSLVLFQSELRPGGPIYTMLERMPLTHGR